MDQVSVDPERDRELRAVEEQDARRLGRGGDEQPRTEAERESPEPSAHGQTLYLGTAWSEVHGHAPRCRGRGPRHDRW